MLVNYGGNKFPIRNLAFCSFRWLVSSTEWAAMHTISDAAAMPMQGLRVKGPIDKVEARVLGKNFFDIEHIDSRLGGSASGDTFQYSKIADTVIQTKFTPYGSGALYMALQLEAGTYTVSWSDWTVAATARIFVLRNLTTKATIKYVNGVTEDVHSYTFTIDEAALVGISMQAYGNASNIFALSTVTDLQVEVGDTATSYQPFTEQTFQFPYSLDEGGVFHFIPEELGLQMNKPVTNVLCNGQCMVEYIKGG